MARVHLKAGTLTAPVPAALVTVGKGEKINVLTVAWTGTLASDPPRTYISVRQKRHSYALLKETGEFVLHLTSEELARATDYCGIYTGAKVNKFEKCAFTLEKSEFVGAPTIAEAPLALECRVAEVIPMGSHDVFVADILSVSVKEELLDKNGRLALDKAHLLAYCHGEYFALGRKLGSFGFSAAKKHKNPTRGGGKPKK